jgi:hypothetical protein
MKEIQETRREFYLLFLEQVARCGTTFNRTTALETLKNPYWEDLDTELKEILIRVAESKTNWGRTLFQECVKEALLRYLLGM